MPQEVKRPTVAGDVTADGRTVVGWAVHDDAGWWAETPGEGVVCANKAFRHVFTSLSEARGEQLCWDHPTKIVRIVRAQSEREAIAAWLRGFNASVLVLGHSAAVACRLLADKIEGGEHRKKAPDGP